MTTDATTPVLRPSATPGGSGPVIRPVESPYTTDDNSPSGDYPDDDTPPTGTPYADPIHYDFRPTGSMAYIGLALIGLAALYWNATRKKRKRKSKGKSRR